MFAARAARRRTLLLRMVTAIIVPALLLALLEAGLWLGGYGEATSLFTPAGDGATLVTRPTWGVRFFPPTMLRDPVPASLAVAKPTGLRRIFVLGGSAAQGAPEPAYGFGRIMEHMLNGTLAPQRFEVINVAMTAINSHVVRHIAAEVAGLEPDLFIVYMGNNEVVGPYGAAEQRGYTGGRLMWIRAAIWLRGTRTGQLLAAIGRQVAPGRAGASAWRGMATFAGHSVARQDPRLARTYANFRDNLQDILALARQAGAPTLLCTVAVNLSDNAPFSTEDAAATQAYARGQALWRGGDLRGAWRAFGEARDQDRLRFRADGPINQHITAAAGAANDPGVQLVDIADVVQRRAQEGPPGAAHPLLWEHVHFRFAGNYAVARALTVAAAAAWKLPLDPAALPTEPACAAALAYTSWSEYQAAEWVRSLRTRPPFKGQAGNAARLAALRGQLGELRSSLTSATMQALDGVYRAALAAHPQDVQLQALYATFLADAAGRPADAAAQFERLLSRAPQRAGWLAAYGRALGGAGRGEAAVDAARAALALSAETADAYGNVGVALASQDRLEEARRHFASALALDPDHARSHYHLAAIDYLQGKNERAGAGARRALELDPDLSGAQELLAALQGPAPAADQANEAAVRPAARPSVAPSVDAQIDYVRDMISQGGVREGIAALEAMLRRDPKPIKAMTALAWTLAVNPDGGIRDGPAALRWAKLANESSHNADPDVLGVLSAAHAEAGDFAAALAAVDRALALAAASADVQVDPRLSTMRDAYTAGRKIRHGAPPHP